jgi:hypothetical protein
LPNRDFVPVRVCESQHGRIEIANVGVDLIQATNHEFARVFGFPDAPLYFVRGFLDPIPYRIE